MEVMKKNILRDKGYHHLLTNALKLSVRLKFPLSSKVKDKW